MSADSAASYRRRSFIEAARCRACASRTAATGPSFDCNAVSWYFKRVLVAECHEV